MPFFAVHDDRCGSRNGRPGVTPTLSEVRNWDTEHLTAAAEHWTNTATVWEDRFTQYATHVVAPGGTPWEGGGRRGSPAACAFRSHERDRVVRPAPPR